MQINVRGVDFKLTDPILQHAESRLADALAVASHRVRHAVAFLGDINGDHGGEDKSCRMVASLHKVGTIVTRAVDRDMYSAVNRAADRLRQAVTRKLARRRKLGQRTMPATKRMGLSLWLRPAGFAEPR